jgi:hypothetical protein
MQMACTGVYIQMRYTYFYCIVEILSQIIVKGHLTNPKKEKTVGSFRISEACNRNKILLYPLEKA